MTTLQGMNGGKWQDLGNFTAAGDRLSTSIGAADNGY
jgi:hypothetical protein